MFDTVSYNDAGCDRITLGMDSNDLNIDDVVMVYFYVVRDGSASLRLQQVVRLYNVDDPILKSMPGELERL